MGKPSKRRKSDGIQFNIGKRIKVQAQRKFAQGAAILPQQTPKEPSIAPNNDTKNQSKKIDFVMPSSPKVYTEDFLTFLCFKSSQSLPSHLRVTSFLQPQTAYNNAPTNSHLTSLESNSQMPQSLSTVQGFIPFGVRKQASQFPKKNVNRKPAIQTIKNKFNAQKQPRFQGIATKKASVSIESRKKILTTKTNGKMAITKTIAKKKQSLVLSSNYSISTRRQSYQQKTLRKTFATTLSTNSHQLRNNVSLRNRMISISSIKPDKAKLQEKLKKKVEKPDQLKQNKSSTSKLNQEKSNSKEDSSSTSKNKDISGDANTTVNSETSMKNCPGKTSARVKNSPKVDDVSNVCRTRSSTVRQQKLVSSTPKKGIVQKAKSTPAVKAPISTPKKNTTEKFEFSSDDDEPLFKKMSNITRSNEKEPVASDQKEEKQSDSHFTRSKIETKTLFRNRNQKIVNSDSNNVMKTIQKTVTSRVTRQNVKEETLNKTIAKQTRSTSINVSNFRKSPTGNKKNIITAGKGSPKKSTPPAKKLPEVKKHVEEQLPVQGKSSEKTICLVNPIVNLQSSSNMDAPLSTNKSKPSILESPKTSTVKLEKSFSESDDEPLAAKLIETAKNPISNEPKVKAKKNNPNEAITQTVKATDADNKKANVSKDKPEEWTTNPTPNIVSDTNLIPSYEESLKIFGIAHRYTDEKLSMTQLVKIKNCNQNKKPVLNIPEKKNDVPLSAIKNDFKNRPSRKFMKPKEYIEQWLKDSARPFVNRATPSSIANVPEVDPPNGNKVMKPREIGSIAFTHQKPNQEANFNKLNTTTKELTTGKAENANVTLSYNANKNDEVFQNIYSKSAPLETTVDDINIYDFESESEMVTSPPKKSKLAKESHKKVDRQRSKFSSPLVKTSLNSSSCKPIGNMQQTMPVLMSDKNPTSFYDISSNKATENENKSPFTESFGNVISKAIIVSLEPTEDISMKDSSNSKIGSSEIYMGNDNFCPKKDNLDSNYQNILSSCSDFNPNSLNNNQIARNQQKYSNVADKQDSTDFSKRLDYTPKAFGFSDGNPNPLDSLKSKKEFISVANSLKTSQNNISVDCIQTDDNFLTNTSEQQQQTCGLPNTLDFANSLFFLQSKKNYVSVADTKTLSYENYVKNFNPTPIYQVGSVESQHNKLNVLISENVTPSNAYQKSFVTNLTFPDQSNNRMIGGNLMQSNLQFSQGKIFNSSNEFDNHLASPSTNITLPKFDRLKPTFNMSDKVNTVLPNMRNVNHLLTSSSKFHTSGLELEKTNSYLGDKQNNTKSEMFSLPSFDINHFGSSQIFEKPILSNESNDFKIDEKKLYDEKLPKNILQPTPVKTDHFSMFSSDKIKDIHYKQSQHIQHNLDYLKGVSSTYVSPSQTIYSINNALSTIFATDHNKVAPVAPESSPSVSLSENQKQTLSNLMTSYASSDNVGDKNVMKLNTADSNAKFSTLMLGKNVSLGDSRGTDSISNISLKNFRLSSKSDAGKSLLLLPEFKSNHSATSPLIATINPQVSTKNNHQASTKNTDDSTSSSGGNNASTQHKESEDHLFYIPLQGVSKTGQDMSNHLIEGVAVKMATQGPNGPQQRVIMRAKLVKKSQIDKNVPKVAEKQTGPMLDMVRSVREAFPEATIHSESVVEVGQAKGKKGGKPAGPAANRKPANAKEKTSKDTNSANCKSTILSGSPLPSTTSQKRVGGKGADSSETISHKNKTAFPEMKDSAQVVEAPVFQPTEKEFQDPLEFIEKISPIAARYGLCRIIPPSSFKPECKISDDMRFTPHNQYLHRMLYRWGPSSREMCAIKKYLDTQSVTFKQPPTLSGIEVDLPRLYHVVQNMGGLNNVLEKKMWHKVAEEMCLPVNVHYMDIRLDEIYCKYLLPYDTLSPDERKKLFESVDKEWEIRQNRMVTRAADPLNLQNTEQEELEYDITEDIEECITRGKSTTLCSFARTAKNTMTMQFGKVQQPKPDEVEAKFWNYVTTRDSHVCVSTGSIDSSVWGYGFPNAKSKNSPISKHPWNLKVLTNNNGSILRSLGPIMGVTVPTIHVGMLFSTCCWYRDPHGLPWVEFLHDGAPKIWYGVPDSQSVKFKETLTSIVPGYCQKKTVWLLSDTTMVPPTMLKDHGVSLCRTIQNPGEFILVFPKAFTSSICAGYNVSESVYFAPNTWLDTAQQDFIDIRNSCEPSMFSLERLIIAISEDIRTPYQVLQKVLPALNKIIQTEKQHREVLFNIGLKISERSQNVFIGKKKVAKRQDEVEECHRCRTSLSLSMLYNDLDGSVFCLIHAAEFLSANQALIDKCKLIYMHSIDELERLQSKLIERINVLANKKCSKVK